ncbi:MAG: recombinase family protein [Bdellovibrionaceae bacterium]|nr:recombinase family protein [Pseudobdellovibrionaceae bacterium]
MGNSTAIYLRVSTDKQSTGLEAQRRALLEYINQAGLSSYVIYQDENVSGAKASRPGLNEMMAAVRSGEHDKVLVYSFSRFARSSKHLIEAMEEFGSLGVAFISYTEKLDTSSPMGRALFTIISAMSQLERELISERVKNGLVNAKAKGKRLGAPKTRPSELIRTLAAQGMSCRKIAILVGCSHMTVARELRNIKSLIKAF